MQLSLGVLKCFEGFAGLAVGLVQVGLLEQELALEVCQLLLGRLEGLTFDLRFLQGSARAVELVVEVPSDQRVSHFLFLVFCLGLLKGQTGFFLSLFGFLVVLLSSQHFLCVLFLDGFDVCLDGGKGLHHVLEIHGCLIRRVVTAQNRDGIYPGEIFTV